MAYCACVIMQRKRENPFAECASDGQTDVTVLVEESMLYLHSYILRHHSPVFKTMLNGNFKEGISKEIELKGKEKKVMITFFKYFYSEYHPGITAKTNFTKLLPLCEEYQVDWLKDHFEKFLIQYKTNGMSEEEMIKYLYLSEKYNLDKLEDLLLNHEFTTILPILKLFWGYNELSSKSKFIIFKKRLYLNIIACDEQKSQPYFRRQFKKEKMYAGKIYYLANEKDEELNEIMSEIDTYFS